MEIKEIEQKVESILGTKADRLKRKWDNEGYNNLLHAVVIYILSIKTYLHCSMQDNLKNALTSKLVGLKESDVKNLCDLISTNISPEEIKETVSSYLSFNPFIDNDCIEYLKNVMEEYDVRTIKSDIYLPNVMAHANSLGFTYQPIHETTDVFLFYLYSVYNSCFGIDSYTKASDNEEKALYIADLSVYMRNSNTPTDINHKLCPFISNENLIFVIPNNMLEYSYVGSDIVNDVSKKIRAFLLDFGYSWQITEFSKCCVVKKNKAQT